MKVPDIDFDLEEMFIEKADKENSNQEDHCNTLLSMRKRSDNLHKIISRKKKVYCKDRTDEMLMQLSTRVKKLRKQIHSRQKQMKEFKNDISKKREIKYRLNKSKLFRAVQILYEYTGYQYEDQRFLIQNLIHLIASGELKPSALEFTKITKIIRMLLGKDSAGRTKENDRIRTGENGIVISKEEYEEYMRLKNYYSNEWVYSSILGLQLFSAGVMLSQSGLRSAIESSPSANNIYSSNTCLLLSNRDNIYHTAYPYMSLYRHLLTSSAIFRNYMSNIGMTYTSDYY